VDFGETFLAVQTRYKYWLEVTLGIYHLNSCDA
jgi:hypothetical protein